jgi:hypothetical protein
MSFCSVFLPHVRLPIRAEIVSNGVCLDGPELAQGNFDLHHIHLFLNHYPCLSNTKNTFQGDKNESTGLSFHKQPFGCFR